MSDYERCKKVAKEIYPEEPLKESLLSILLAASNVTIDPSAALIEILADAKELLKNEGLIMSSEDGKVVITKMKDYK